MVTAASVRAHVHLAASTTAVLREAGPLSSLVARTWCPATRRAQHAQDVPSTWQLFPERLSRQSQFPTWLWVKSRHLRQLRISMRVIDLLPLKIGVKCLFV